MAILRSTDGKFYNVPDAELEKHLVPAEDVKAKLADYAAKAEDETAGQDVRAHGASWRNCWRNCYRPKPKPKGDSA